MRRGWKDRSHFFLLRRSFSTVPVPSLVRPNGSAEPRSSEGVEAGEVEVEYNNIIIIILINSNN